MGFDIDCQIIGSTLNVDRYNMLIDIDTIYYFKYIFTYTFATQICDLEVNDIVVNKKEFSLIQILSGESKSCLATWSFIYLERYVVNNVCLCFAKIDAKIIICH